MKKFGRAGSTFGTVIIAVIILALAGTTGAVAGGLITSKKIKDNTIKSRDVRDGALTGTDVADNSLTGSDVANGSLTGLDLTDGSVGTADIGAAAVKAAKLGTIVERTDSVAIANGAGDFVQVACEAGETLIGGGASSTGVGVDDGWTLIRSSKVGANGWDAAVWNATGSSGTLIVEAYCLQ